jgi:hypothetical protein
VEAETFLAAMKDLKLADGRDRIVRHGHGPTRTIQTGIGPVDVNRVKLRDRGAASDGERIRFTSAILPLWARRTRSLDALLPVLYLRGISTGDFQEALTGLLGKNAPNLSPAVISRLTAEWQGEYERWHNRDLSARRYVYVWADGVFLQARMEDHGECMLVLIGATPEGKKELIGFQVGVRESTQSWRELLIDVKRRGLQIAPEIAVGDGALGFWKALDEVFPGTRRGNRRLLREIRCQVRQGGRMPDERSRGTARVLRLPRRALGSLAHEQSYRERVCNRAAQDGTHERILVTDHRQTDGVQARDRRIKHLAEAERNKSVAEAHRRCQIHRRHRGHPSAGKPRRLIASSPKIPHSFLVRPSASCRSSLRHRERPRR